MFSTRHSQPSCIEKVHNFILKDFQRFVTNVTLHPQRSEYISSNRNVRFKNGIMVSGKGFTISVSSIDFSLYSKILLVPLLLTWINSAWMRNHMPSKVWDEITYQFPNFNDTTVLVWERISNFVPHFIMGVIIIHAGINFKPCWYKGPLNICML